MRIVYVVMAGLVLIQPGNVFAEGDLSSGSADKLLCDKVDLTCANTGFKWNEAIKKESAKCVDGDGGQIISCRFRVKFTCSYTTQCNGGSCPENQFCPTGCYQTSAPIEPCPAQNLDFVIERFIKLAAGVGCSQKIADIKCDWVVSHEVSPEDGLGNLHASVYCGAGATREPPLHAIPKLAEPSSIGCTDPP